MPEVSLGFWSLLCPQSAHHVSNFLKILPGSPFLCTLSTQLLCKAYRNFLQQNFVFWPSYFLKQIDLRSNFGTPDYQIFTNHSNFCRYSNKWSLNLLYLNLLCSTLGKFSALRFYFPLLKIFDLGFLYILLSKNSPMCKLCIKICKFTGYGLVSIKSVTKIGFKFISEDL